MPKPNKYDAILPTLRPRPVEDQSYQDKVEKSKGEILESLKNENTAASADVLATMYTISRFEKEQIENMLYNANIKLEALAQMLITSQDAKTEGWGRYGVKDNALRLPNGDTIRIQTEPYGKVNDKEAFRLWCLDNGYERQLQLWPSTMNAIVKERLVAGEEPPVGTEAFSYSKVVYTPKKDQ